MSICRFRRPHLAVLVLLLAALTLPLAVAAPFRGGRQFMLRLGVPAAGFGARYTVGLRLTTAGVEVRPADNIAQIEVLIAHQRYLPAVGR